MDLYPAMISMNIMQLMKLPGLHSTSVNDYVI